MEVKYIKDHKLYKAGEVKMVTNSFGQELIKKGIAIDTNDNAIQKEESKQIKKLLSEEEE